MCDRGAEYLPLGRVETAHFSNEQQLLEGSAHVACGLLFCSRQARRRRDSLQPMHGQVLAVSELKRGEAAQGPHPRRCMAALDAVDRCSVKVNQLC